MKKLAFPLIIVALLAALVPVAVSAHTAGNPLTAKLMAGQSIYSGHVQVWNDGTNLHVRYQAKSGEGFCLNETHLHVATSLADIPQKNGNPIPGHFDYKDDDLGCVHDVEYVIPLDGWGADTQLFIAAHAVVGDMYDPYFEETAWGVLCGHLDRYGFPGRNWAAYIPYTVQ
ncbi:MAG: hypothetical protein GTO49_01265 [Anaerolineae bacterium]|nr:hypothetical protein [Anaerolineae bacterium]